VKSALKRHTTEEPPSQRASASSAPKAAPRKSCLKKSVTCSAMSSGGPPAEERHLLGGPALPVSVTAAELAKDSMGQASDNNFGKRSSSKCSSVDSETWCGNDEDHRAPACPAVVQASAAEDFMRRLSLCDDRAEMWTVAGLCKRAYCRSAQRNNWPKAKFVVEPSIMPITRCTNTLPVHMQERLCGSALGRRVSMREPAVVLDGALLIGGGSVASQGNSESSSSRCPSDHPKIQRATSVLICIEGDGPAGGEVLPPDPETLAEAGGTGADKDPPGAEPSEAPPDTGGTPPQQRAHPLLGVLTAKKVNIKQLQEVLQNLPDAEHWVNHPLDHGPPALPSPLFYAIGATLPQAVALLLEHSADVRRRFKGPKVYNGWIKPEATPIEAVANRKGRFVGTMLGDRLEEVLGLLRMADAQGKEEQQGKEKQQEDMKKRLSRKLDKMMSEELHHEVFRVRKSILLPGAHGAVQHTQGHPSLMYDVAGLLGEGSLSTVNLAIHRESSERRAIKAEMKFEEWVIWDEIAIMRKLYHPNIIQLWETFEDDTNIFVVLEACTGGELFNRLAVEGGVPESHAARLMMQLAAAVRYIHNQKICHRDIQPENFLLKDDGPLSEATVKLIDFTTAKEFGPGSPLKTKICSLHYVAPEILSRKELPYTEKVDVWSLGVVFFVILCGCPPFYGDSEVAVLKKIKRGSFKFTPLEVWNNISKEAKDLVQEMLVVDVVNRYTADDVTNHPWLSRDLKNVTQSQQNHLSTEQLHSLRNFHARNRVQKVVQRLRAHDMSTAATNELRDIFQRLDRNSTGEVHVSSVRDRIRRIPALNENLEEIMRVLWSLEHGSGKVNYDDFVKALVARQNSVQQEACRAIFDVFDFDGSGTISRDELKMALGLDSRNDDSFKAGVETVFGMPANEVESRFAVYLDKEEYPFDKFFEIMKQGCSAR